MLCKMVKKGVTGLALGGAALGVLSLTPAWNRVITPTWECVESLASRTCLKVAKKIPFDTRIDLARKQIAKLDAVIDDEIDIELKAQRDVDRLTKEIARTEADLHQEARELQALNEHLKTGDTHLTGGVAYKTVDVKADLVRRMEHYKLVQALLAEKHETLEVCKKNVLSIREVRCAKQAAKLNLMARINKIEARLAKIHAAEAKRAPLAQDTVESSATLTVDALETDVEDLERGGELKAEGNRPDRRVVVTVEPTRDDISAEVDAELRKVEAELRKPTGTAQKSSQDGL